MTSSGLFADDGFLAAVTRTCAPTLLQQLRRLMDQKKLQISHAAGRKLMTLFSGKVPFTLPKWN